MKVSVFDFHCDTALVMLDEKLNPVSALRRNSGHVDLVRAARLEGYAQCFACFTTPLMEKWYPITPEQAFKRELENLQQEIDKNSDLISLAGSTQDIENNRRSGKLSAILTMEGTAGIGYDAGRLEDLWKTGFRIVSLGWNEQNILTGSHMTGGGLTDRGREFVREAQRLGYLVDVSHISDEGFWDIMEITGGPVIATHSNSRSVWHNSRNLTDDMFRAIVQTGGVAGYNACAEFTGENPDLDSICRHILHFMELDPTISHISLGGDLDGIDKMPIGFAGVQSWPVLADRLLEHGLTEENVHQIFWNNAMGVMDLAVCNHTK